MNDIDVREVPTAALDTILDLVGRQNPKISPEQLAHRLELMAARHYRCVGAYLDGKLVGVAGIWTGCRFYCGPYIEADNVIVDPAYRNRGIGQKLMDWIHDEGRRLGCYVAGLDSYVTFTDAHRFYERMGYTKLGYHFVLPLDNEEQPEK
jgi:GNAT superfamily N-acetyltransferase